MDQRASSGGRVEHARAFVLHSYPYSETSLVVDAFTREFGRVPLVARGARRPRSAMRGVLLGFQPLALGWTGRGEVRTLTRAEWQGGLPRLAGDALLCGFYVNELLMRMLAREDPHERLFDDYHAALVRLASGDAPEPLLRWFEKRLLDEAGYALVLDHDAEHRPIEPAAEYTYDPESGPVRLRPGAAAEVVIAGAALLALATDDYSDAATLTQSKAVMRMLINHRLEQRPILSRQVLRELARL
jgi:DNA repair protein RecO (recombination protein O)